MIDEVFRRALLPAPEHVIDAQVVEARPIRCHLCPHRESRYWGNQDDVYLPLCALWDRPCPRCYDWLLNESGILLGGLVVFKERHANVRMRG